MSTADPREPDHDPSPAGGPPVRGHALRSSLTVELSELAALPGSPVPADFAAQPDLRRILDGERTSTWTIGGLGLVGFGRAANVVVTGEGRFTAARAWWDGLLGQLEIADPLARSATGPVAFGAFTFARASSASSGLVLPELVVGHDHDGAWVTLVSERNRLEPADVADAWRRLVPRVFPAGHVDELPAGSAPRQAEDEAAARSWCSAVSDGVELIREGHLQKLVLARAVSVHGRDRPLDIPRALRALARDYDTCWTYCVNVDPDRGPSAGRLFGATPERLVRVLDGTLHARVLAGTLDRAAAPGDQDGTLWARRKLLEDPKQRAEHEFAIASLLQSVAAYTREVRSSADPFVLELPNVWHLASDVAAELTPGADGTVPSALELVEAVHPTAAVCGTPTHAAAEAITQLEGMDRGLYAGPVGWLDSRHNGDFGIALRGGVQRTPALAQVYAGCGVVGASVPEEELAETRAKLRPVLGALGVAADGSAGGS
ncbi:isochorismate synthase [Kocuria coralli]|uniref:isochorismate synthase n=1 Tax=Kocuria coralli TaxID=1461025 RepID=A0A5J5L0W7_9MICC|nr:isochorismate synthase [Kocuria coralli]KAA9395270.1 isochorismate synthase [Kocuria coralli]